MSFNEVYINHFSELRRFGRRLNVSSELIDDLIQETFLRFYLQLKKDVVFENPRAWLYKVFLNQFKTSIVSHHHGTTDSERVSLENLQSADFQEEYSKNEEKRIVFEILESLDKRDKELLLLYHEGFSYIEMAEILEINPNSVGKTLVRAIGKLKETLKIQYHEMFE
jgi:RNA polymerase sigma factor (sigma-70 family)